MRIMFIGASSFGMKCLAAIRRLSDVSVVGVLTNPRIFSVSYSHKLVKRVLHVDFLTWAAQHILPRPGTKWILQAPYPVWIFEARRQPGEFTSPENEQHDFRAYMRWFASPVGVVSGLILAFNILVDAYGIFGTGFITNYDNNPRYTKYQRLMQSEKPVEGIVFGSCVSSTLAPDTLTKASGRNFFNFSTHISLTREPTTFLERITAESVPVREVLLNADNYLRSDELPDVAEENQIRRPMNARWPHFFGINDRMDFYGPYAFSWVGLHSSLVTLMSHIQHKIPPVIERSDGFWDWRAGLEMAENNPRKLAEEILSVAHVRQPMKEREVPSSLKSFDDLRALKKVAKEKDIHLTCFVPPSWALRPTFPWQGKYSEWQLTELLKVCGEFYDFRLYNDKTFDIRQFITYENFVPQMGDVIISAIYEGKNRRYVYHVTPTNLDAYLAFKRKQAEIFEREIFPHIKDYNPADVLSPDFRALAKKFPTPPGDR